MDCATPGFLESALASAHNSFAYGKETNLSALAAIDGGLSRDD